MAVLATSNLSLPPHMASKVFEQAKYGSTVAALVGAEPMLFGETEYMTFSDPKAEFVGEGAQKSHDTVTPTTVTVKPYKAQVTMRFNEEVLWADEDYQLGVLTMLGDKTAPALARALDFGIYHGLNPLSGTAFAAMTVFLSQTTNSVESTGDNDLRSNENANSISHVQFCYDVEDPETPTPETPTVTSTMAVTRVSADSFWNRVNEGSWGPGRARGTGRGRWAVRRAF